MNQVVVAGQGIGFVCICPGAKKTVSNQTGIGGGAGHTDSVEAAGGGHPGTGRAVVFIHQFRARIIVTIHIIPALSGYDVRQQVFMSNFQPIINNGDNFI